MRSFALTAKRLDFGPTGTELRTRSARGFHNETNWAMKDHCCNRKRVNSTVCELSADVSRSVHSLLRRARSEACACQLIFNTK